MSKAPFSKPDVNIVVSSSHVFKVRSNLNRWSRGRQPKPGVKHLYGIVVITLLLLSLQLAACGNPTSPLGSASPNSNSTSLPGTPSTSSSSAPGSTTTAGPTNNPTAGPTIVTEGPTNNPTAGPTTVPTVVPTAGPKSFTVSEFEFDLMGGADQSDPNVEHITLNNSSILPLFWSVSVAPDSARAWLSLNPSSGKLLGTKKIDLIVSNLKAHLPPGSYTGTLTFTPVNPNHDNTVTVTLTVVPSVSKVSPASGPAAGSTSVTITGSGFTGATGVSFGSTATSGVTVNSDTQITATSPTGSGTVDVFVTDAFGTSLPYNGDQFTYISAPSGPTVSKISPAGGPAAGGTSVIITGSGFTGATGVSFSATAVSSFTVDSDTQITALSPAGSGTVDVIVTTPNGTSATGATDQFTYT